MDLWKIISSIIIYELDSSHWFGTKSQIQKSEFEGLSRLNHRWLLVSALSLVQGARKPFEECSALDLNPDPNQIAYSDDDSDEQNDTDDSTWEISSISDDGDDDGESNELNDKKYTTAAEAPDTFPTRRVTTTNSQQPSQLIFLVQKPNKELPQLLETINFVVSCLYQLPFRHVTPRNRSRQGNLSMIADLHQSDDLNYIMCKYPNLGPKVAARIKKIIYFHRLQILNESPNEDVKGLGSTYPYVELGPLLMGQISEAETARK